MRTDLEIKQDVLDEMEWQPNIDETQIGVIVENGIVTLKGTVNSYSKKMEAEKAAENVKGVKAVAEDIEVKYGTTSKKSDTEVAKAVANSLNWNSSVPDDKISVKVEDGWVYLSGEVNYIYQKDAAKRAVQNLTGVKHVKNSLSIKQVVKPFEIKKKITKALERLADLDAKTIIVEADGHTVKLRGKVHSMHEKDEARKVAYLAPGVYKVKNELEVVY